MKYVLIVIKKEEKMDMNGHVLRIITLYIHLKATYNLVKWFTRHFGIGIDK